MVDVAKDFHHGLKVAVEDGKGKIYIYILTLKIQGVYECIYTALAPATKIGENFMTT